MDQETSMANYITPTKAGALALTPTQFSQQHFDLLNAQLRVYFNTLDSTNNQIISAVNTLSTPSAGTTGDRPSTDLQVGQFYFDTTINRPIWWDGTNWINAAGTVV
jgi:hypothetical protein